MSIGTKDVAALTGISAYTIRYYDKCGFFPNIHRGKGNIRDFTDADIHQLELVDALRKSGLSIEGISYFVKLQNAGSSKGDLRNITDQQITALEYQIAEMDKCLERLKQYRMELTAEPGVNNE